MRTIEMEKNNNKFQTLLKIALWFAPIIVGFALALGAYRERLSAMQLRVEAVETLATANQISIVGITRDILYIKEGINRIEKSMNQKERAKQ